MILNTHPDNRKDMVKAISEHTMLHATYMGMPSGAYQIGTITCNDEKTIENIRPLLIARGWLEAEPECVIKPADSGALDQSRHGQLLSGAENADQAACPAIGGGLCRNVYANALRT